MTTASENRWATFVALGLLTATGFAIMQVTGAVPALAGALYTGLSALTAATVLVVTHRRRPPGRLGWYLLGAGQIAYTIGDALHAVSRPPHDGPAFPSVADAFYLVQYPLLVGALVAFVRRRTPGRHTPTLIDAGIIAVSVGLVSWVYLIGPLTADEGLSPAARLVTVAYPVGDLLVLVLGLRMLLGGGARTPSYLLLLTSLLTMLGADVAATLSRANAWSCFLWLATYALLGGAALHPSMDRIDAPASAHTTRTTAARLAVLAGASLLAPAVLLLRYLQGDVSDVPVIAIACALLFLLVLGRMAGMVAAQHRIAVTDGLTGLSTRRAFEEQLRAETGRRRHRGFGVVLLDIDHFKAINDEHGHAAGDRVLRDVARRLRAAARADDTVARYGGEEFAVLAPDAGEAEVAALAERVRRVVAGGTVDVGDGVHRCVTVSVGTAVLPDDTTEPDELVQLADRALYAAKRDGRDRVVAARRAPARPVHLPRSRRSEFEAA
ncbi:GGDEF domain-containing protein [Dactylosporangium fulvum]|uniref:GGDEF domain-containing protein n=1 Tax=Dactylosporangium fulvum TaxID=53359 RepID=A0ABY5VUM8_9ACTN|nr:GGDEF domain-containing protein [Dactylosporangium fulvum]UWP81467.1 GGDEF domain-containing protein [Dactylosporangium fulvum]